MLTFPFLTRGTHPTPPRINAKPACSAGLANGRYVTALRRTAPLALALALLAPALPSALAAPATPPNGAADPGPPGIPHTLAVFDDPSALSTLFIERGAGQFASITRDGLSWSPTATNIYTLILAKRGVPLVTRDKTIVVTFRLPTDGASLGLHLHGKSESAPSHLVLVSRTAGERGLIRVYRTPTWPSGTIAATDMLPSAQARMPAFPSGGWYRLVITTQTGPATEGTTLSTLLFSENNETVIASLDAHDSGPTLPDAGLVAIRLFAPPLGRIDVRALIAQP